MGLFDQPTRDLWLWRNNVRRAGARAALAEGRPDSAVELLRAVRADNSTCRFCDLVTLGEAYDRAGMADSALACYQRYLETPGARLGTDADWLARTLRRVGELEEATGGRAEALEYPCHVPPTACLGRCWRRASIHEPLVHPINPQIESFQRASTR